MIDVDETVRVEEWNILQICELFKKYKCEGYGGFEAIKMYESGVDYHDLEILLKRGCNVEIASMILSR